MGAASVVSCQKLTDSLWPAGQSLTSLEIVNHLMSKGEKKLTTEERWLLRMLVRLIEDFEEKAYPINEAQPRAMLKTLMEDRGLKQIDLAPLFGGRSRVSDVLAGKRDISKAQAKALAAFFKVPADLFI